MILQEFFTENPAVALGFSGGADSSYLLYAALRCGARVRAYYVKTAFQPAFELADAHRMAVHLGADLTVVEADILADPQIVSNPVDRCYHCKKRIFGKIAARAETDGFPMLLDGTNASDDVSDRPGFRALAELSVRSPLRECGLTKSDIRRLSKEAGLFTWDKPAYACLATRVPTGQMITSDLLCRVEAAEEALFQMGFIDFRVRVMGEAAKIQIIAERMPMVLEKRDAIITALKPYFPGILLDLEGR